MFLFNGEIGDKQYKDEQMSGTRLYKEVMKNVLTKHGIDLNRAKVEFLIKMRKDRQGQLHVGGVKNLLNTFNIRIGNRDCTVTYFDRTTGSGDNRKYLPRKTQVVSGSKQIMTEDDFDLALFLAIHPRNQSSPFFNKRNGRPFLEFVDREAIANAKIAQQETRRQMVDIIMDFEDFDKLKKIAKGIRIKSGGTYDTVPTSATTNLNMLKVSLLELANRHGEKFKQAFEDNNTETLGQIQELIDNASIVREEREWKFSQEFGGNRILTVPSGANVNEAIFDHLSNPKKLKDVLSRIKDNPLHKAQDNEIREKVEKLVELGVLEVTKDQKILLDGSTLIVFDSMQTYIDELLEKYNNAPVVKARVNKAITDNIK